jgi:hypothetical protein
MLGAMTSYLAGFSAGESATESRRDLQRASHAFIYGVRPVEVDQRYIDGLQTEVDNARSQSQHNAKVAHDWIAYAKALESQLASLRAQVAELERTKAERNGLRLFMYMVSRLLLAQRAGKCSKPEFVELRETALEIAGMHNRGEVFPGYADQPEKMARLRKIWAALR